MCYCYITIQPTDNIHTKRLRRKPEIIHNIIKTDGDDKVYDKEETL